jgi:hypothetical protein
MRIRLCHHRSCPGSLVTEAPSKLLRYVRGFKQPSHADVTGRSRRSLCGFSGPASALTLDTGDARR